MKSTRSEQSRLRSVGALSIAAVLALVGCSASNGSTRPDDTGTPISGGTLAVARGNLFEGFNLDQETLNASFQLSEAVLEPLIRTNPEGTDLQPGIAAAWKFNDDNTKLTVDLNPDAKFSDGSPVTPADIAFSVETWQAGPN